MDAMHECSCRNFGTFSSVHRIALLASLPFSWSRKWLRLSIKGKTGKE
jgi:hypothetical protein